MIYFFIMSFTYFTYNLFTFLLPIYHQAISICIHIELLLLLSEFNLLDDRCLLIFSIFELLLTHETKILGYIALTSTITLDLFFRLTPYLNSFGPLILFLFMLSSEFRLCRYTCISKEQMWNGRNVDMCKSTLIVTLLHAYVYACNTRVSSLLGYT